jgi:hypothetical protein
VHALPIDGEGFAIVEELLVFAVRHDVSAQTIRRANAILHHTIELDFLPAVGQHLVGAGFGTERKGLQGAQEAAHLLESGEGFRQHGRCGGGRWGTRGRLLLGAAHLGDEQEQHQNGPLGTWTVQHRVSPLVLGLSCHANARTWCGMHRQYWEQWFTPARI